MISIIPARLAVTAAMLVAAAGCNKPAPPQMVERDIQMPETSRPWKISNARSAAPGDISKDALVLDRPPNDTTTGEELALGSSDWTCWPDDPKTTQNDPVCMDEGGREWSYASQARRAPRIATVGLIYRLQGSAEDAPHVAVIMPNPQRVFAGLPTTPQKDKPWVKYAGTPWAYMVIPVARP